MANLKQFIAPDARTGGSFDVYVARIPVGSGKYGAVEPLRVEVEGEAKTPFGPIKGSVRIIMPDLAPSGTCTVILNGAEHTPCRYRTEGPSLLIDIPGVTELVMRDHDRSYSWVQAKGIWAGLWTTAAVFTDADLADGPPAEAEASATAGA